MPRVTITTHGFGKYGRIIADVTLTDDTSLNQQLIREGMCRLYRKYAPGNVTLEELERRARGSGIGLWGDSNPVPPWEWRKQKQGRVAEKYP